MAKSKSKSTPTRTRVTKASILRTSPRGKHRRVPTIGEELEGEKKTKRNRSEKVSNKNKNLDHDKAKKARKPVGAKEPAVRREQPPVGAKEPTEGEERPPAKRPNLRRTPTATDKTNTPPPSKFVVPTKYDILLSMSDDEDEEYYDEGDDDNKGDKQDDGNNEVEDNDDDNEDEEYGDEEDRSDDNEGHDNGSAEEAIAEDYGGSSGEEEMDEGQTNRRGTTASFSQRKFREHLERMNREERRAEEPRLRAVDSTACQTASKLTTPSSSGMQHLDKVIVHVMTRKESLRNWQTHVATRVRAFVKNQLFRKVKFVNNDLMIRKAMKVVMDHEDVAEAKRVNFHVLYESAFNEALNTKRSACEQAGGKIVIEAMATMNPD